jgi:hypothetical protein
MLTYIIKMFEDEQVEGTVLSIKWLLLNEKVAK